MPPGSYPLTVAQSEFWFGEAMRPGSANIAGMVQTLGRVDVGRARAAVDALVERHDALRTTFRRVRGGTTQLVSPAAVSAVEVVSVDLGRSPSGCAADTVDDLLDRHFLEPFDLITGPLLRLMAVRQPDYTTTVALVCNHIVADNWTMKLLWRELFALYQDPDTAGRDLPSSPATMGSLALWERGQQASGGWAQVRQRALGTLRGAACLPDLAAPRAGRFETIDLRFNSQQERLLEGLRRAAGGTRYAVAFVLFARALARRFGAEELTVFVPVSNRDTHNWHAVGAFANTVPVPITIGRHADLREQVEGARPRLAGAIAIGRWPLGLLARALEPAARRRLLGADRLRVTVREIAADPARSLRPGEASTLRGSAAGLGGQNPGLPMDLLLEVGTTTWSLTYDVASVGRGTARRLLDLVTADLANSEPAHVVRVEGPEDQPDARNPHHRTRPQPVRPAERPS